MKFAVEITHPIYNDYDAIVGSRTTMDFYSDSLAEVVAYNEALDMEFDGESPYSTIVRWNSTDKRYDFFCWWNVWAPRSAPNCHQWSHSALCTGADEYGYCEFSSPF